MINNQDFFEYENVHGYYYGTIKSRFDEASEDKQNFFMRDIDVNGHQKLKNYYKEKLISVFLDAPDEILRERLLNRGEEPQRIDVRLSRAALERKHKNDYSLVINNIDKEETIKIIENYLKLFC